MLNFIKLIWLGIGLCLVFSVSVGTKGFKYKLLSLFYSPCLTLGFLIDSSESLHLAAVLSIINCSYAGAHLFTLVVGMRERSVLKFYDYSLVF